MGGLNVLLCGGGTAGHVNPAIAIADFIKARNPKANIRFVGTAYGIENTLVRRAGYDLHLIEVYGLQRKLTLKNLRTAVKAVTAYGDSLKLLKEFAPDVVVGTGGYVSGPVVLAASKLGIPTAIHEQNATPGLTTARLARRADLVLLAFAEAGERLHCKRSVLVGNPVKQSMLFVDRATARGKLGLAEDRQLVVSFGGSMGSRRFNEDIADFMALHSKRPSFLHIHAAGQFGIKWMPERLRQAGVSADISAGIDLREYIFDMQEVMTAADLVICRAGAITLSELAVTGRPSVLIPSPNVTGNHQFYNALAFERAGAALLLEEKQSGGQALYDRVTQLLRDPARLRAMSEAATRLAVFDSTQRMYDAIMALVRHGG